MQGHRASNVPPPSWRPASAGGLRVDIRVAMIPLSLALLAVLAFGFDWRGAKLIAAAVVLQGGYFGLLWYASRQLVSFEKEFAGLMMRDDVEGMMKQYQGATLLRWFAPRHRMLSKLGMIFSLRGKHGPACDLLEEAYEAAPASERAALLGPLARTKYHLDEDVDLMALAEQWYQRSPFPGAPNVYLAAAHVRSPIGDLDRAKELLDEVQGGLADEEERIAAELKERLG